MILYMCFLSGSGVYRFEKDPFDDFVHKQRKAVMLNGTYLQGTIVEKGN